VGFDVVGYQRLLQGAAEERLADEVARLQLSPALRRRAVVKPGPPAETIVLCAKVERADLIVIATHGRTGVRRLLFGSVAEKVVRTAGCPVLTIQSEEEGNRG
jgi:nucleotide-binding universal stress UspA family protein